ncbi:MAG: hypothetical protein NTY61_01630 [Candidatus Parcubacteria bacterium]|nr:hypothetical protein [Candidatus Parcubacteria bacterium]
MRLRGLLGTLGTIALIFLGVDIWPHRSRRSSSSSKSNRPDPGQRANEYNNRPTCQCGVSHHPDLPRPL